jgi:hypothetical protein
MKLVPKTALLAALLSAGVILPAHAADAPSKTYTIAAAPLAEALNRFAADAGVILVFDANLLRGLQSRGLQGKYDLQSGFQALLSGTRYEAVLARSGAYILRERPTPPPPPSREQLTEAKPDAAMGEITVTASTLPTVDKLDREMIVNLATINGDLTSQLKLNPNIQYAEAQLSSHTGGEIAPAEISIHGAKPFQNEILLDGVSIANDIDPGNKMNASSIDVIPGSAQSLAIDSSILCDIEVKDSNVSAEYGRFTGGVVTSRVCSARKKLGGSVAVGYTSSDWSTLFIDPARQVEFEQSSNENYQPRFSKWTYKTTLEARPTDEWGVLVSAVRRTSAIPLRRFKTANEDSTLSQDMTQRRKQDTLVVKSDYTPAGSPHKAELTMVYAPSANTYYIENFRDGDYTIDGGGLNLSSRLESRYDMATLTNQLSYSRNQQSRRGDANIYRLWRWSADKNWGDPTATTNPTSGEGSWGDIDQEMKSLEYKFRSVFKPFTLGASKHRVVAGLEARHQEAEYARLKDQYYYYTSAVLPASGAMANCQLSDGSYDTSACSSAPTLIQGAGQYFRNLMIYRAGSFDLSTSSWAGYVEDELSWRNLTLRVGVRADRDGLTGNTNAAPRLKLGWQAADPLYLDVGLNRYYGRNLFAYALQEKIATLKTTQSRNGTLSFSAPAVNRPENRLDDMRSPYDDEFTAGLTYDGELLAGPLSVRFTRRNGHDQIVKIIKRAQTDCAGSQCYVYTNNGASVAKDLTVSWSNARAFKTGNVATRMWVAANKSDITSNYSDYTSAVGASVLEDSLINYDGKVIHYSEKPADNFNRPWTLRVGAMSTIASQQLSISNILRVRGGYQQFVRNGTVIYQGASIDNYEIANLPRSTAIDTVVHWSPRVYRDQRLDVKLTIENLTNKKNQMTISDSFVAYERGRTFALEIGYAF